METYGPQWVLSTLCGPNTDDRCLMDIPETILIQESVPKLWIHTSRSGDIAVRQTIKVSNIEKMFFKQSLSDAANIDNRVCLARYADGHAMLYDTTAFLDFLRHFPPDDSTMVAIQAYVHAKGGVGTVYRNSYEIVNDKAKIITGTHKVMTMADLEPSSRTGSVPTRLVERAPIRCTAAVTNKRLDKITRSLIRFIEIQHRIRVLKLSIDYVIDDFDKVYLMWCSPVKTASGAAAVDLRLTDVTPESQQRGKWVGVPSESTAEVRERARKREATARSPSATRRLGGRGDNGGNGSKGVLGGDGTLPSAPFPSGYKCKGDFCQFRFNNAGATLKAEEGGEPLPQPSVLSGMKDLFTADEWHALQAQLETAAESEEALCPSSPPFSGARSSGPPQARTLGPGQTQSRPSNGGGPKVVYGNARPPIPLSKSLSGPGMSETSAPSRVGLQVVLRRSVVLARKERRHARQDTLSDMLLQEEAHTGYILEACSVSFDNSTASSGGSGSGAGSGPPGGGGGA